MTDTILKRRRGYGAVAAAAAAVLALTACSNTDANNADADANGGTETVDTALPAAEGTTEYPLTLTTWAGDSVLEERPERIAVIGVSPNFDYLEALDVVPTYTITEDTDWAWRDAAWTEQIETVDTATRRDDVNLEGIAQTEPDLIVAFNSIDDDTTYNRLTDIAPVLDFEQKEGDQGDWREAQLAVGEALDLAEAAETAVSEVDDYIAQVKADNPQFEGKSVAMAVQYDNGLQFYNPTGSTTEEIFTDMGFAPNEAGERFVDDNVVSNENLSLLDADVLIVVYTDAAARDEMENSDLFSSLSVVEDGGYLGLIPDEEDVYTMVKADGTKVENPTWVFRRGASTLSLPWALDVLSEQWFSGLNISEEPQSRSGLGSRKPAPDDVRGGFNCGAEVCDYLRD